ncbi:MAG TPA: hypothetical protein VLS93_16065 [Anaeromyxobacteraceae bacterium]|nr:hypothetical protein [Anaeromyxobacteraceae bacterium]
MSFFGRMFGRKDGGGETPDFEAFLEASLEGLRLQASAHQGTWRLGEEERRDLSQDTGELVFIFPDQARRGPSGAHCRLVLR